MEEKKMTTDWQKMREQRIDYDLSAPDEKGPTRILEVLAGLGLKGREQEGLVLLEQDGAARAQCIALVSASELFSWDDAQETRVARRRVGRFKGMTDLFSHKVATWRQAIGEFCGPHAYLYLIDLDSWLDDPGNQDVAAMLEHDERGVLKTVCRPVELQALLGNPFGAVRPSGHDGTPEFEVQRMDRHSFEPAVRDFGATVTHPFVRVPDTECWLERLVAHPESERVTALANALVHRVMGNSHELCVRRPEVLITRSGRTSAMPWFVLGMGEQYGLAYCIYLALAFDEASPEMWLGITDALNYLDLPHYVRAMDVLRDFVVVTGANTYVKTNKEQYQQLAKTKLEKAVSCCKAMNG
jgi:hypothetical protein